MNNFRRIAMTFGMTCGLMLLIGCSEEPDPLDALIPDMTPVPSGKKTTATSGVKSKAPERPVPAEKGPWPKVVAREKLFDFGRMSVGTELEHTFELVNEGDADLVLQPGKPTCKCTAFAVSPETVKPGESAILTVRWKGKFKDSKFQHGGPVYTNDPKKSTVQFVVKGIVDASLDLMPQETWSVGEMIDGEPGTVEGVLVSRVHEKISITDVKCDSDLIETEVIPLTEDELEREDAVSGYRIRVTVDPSMPPGLLEEKLLLTVDCEKAPVAVDIVANKHGPIRILPLPGVIWEKGSNTLRLGQFSSKKGREASLMLLVEEGEDGEPLSFTDVKSKPSYLEAKLERLGSVGKTKARYKLTIVIPPGIPHTEHGRDDPGVIDVETNHPSGQSLRMKVTYKAKF